MFLPLIGESKMLTIEELASMENGSLYYLHKTLLPADWIDPSFESADYPVLNAVLLSTHKNCHGKGN